MRISDTLTGAGLVLGTALVLVFSSQLPSVEAQPYGPAVFPSLLGVGLLICGASLIVSSLPGGSRPLLSFAVWTRSSTAVRRFASVPAALIFYLVAAEWLGFIIASTVILAMLMIGLGRRALTSIGVAAAVTVLIHTVFVKALLVPLPWGLLQTVRW